MALPEFKFGGMENYGVILYLNEYVLKQPQTLMADEQIIVRIISHEVAHQWFGNMVTARWWNELWLNEGFARYLDFIAADHLRPEWNMVSTVSSMTPSTNNSSAQVEFCLMGKMIQFADSQFQHMHEDSRLETRPVIVDVTGKSSEIESTVDPLITYGKVTTWQILRLSIQ